MLVCNERMRVVELLRSYYAHVTAPIKVCRECTSSTSSLPSFFRDIVYFTQFQKYFFRHSPPVHSSCSTTTPRPPSCAGWAASVMLCRGWRMGTMGPNMLTCLVKMFRSNRENIQDSVTLTLNRSTYPINVSLHLLEVMFIFMFTSTDLFMLVRYIDNDTSTIP